MKEERGNILDVPRGIICQQVNCQGAMGSGLALQIKKKWPVVYHRYRAYVQQFGEDKSNLLGALQFVIVDKEAPLAVANVFGQFKYGRDACHTNDLAVDKAFAFLSSVVEERDTPVYIPYNMGCGLGGGSWAIYQAIVEKHIPRAIIMRLP
tara:strand:- start:2095 stop:2547 length:453 start_codon:yes stop_codon:yes gene_type:complete